MAYSPVKLFPLSEVNIPDRRRLAQCMWKWEICDLCNGGGTTCTRLDCSWSREKRLKYFWNRYEEITAAYMPMYDPVPVLSSHEDLRKVIATIQNSPDLDRNQLLQQSFPEGIADPEDHAKIRDQNLALNMATSILFMTNCGARGDCADYHEDDRPPINWRGSLTTKGFTTEAYPAHKHPYFDSSNKEFKKSNVIHELDATKLARIGFKFEPTNDLRSHLVLVHERRTIRIFHMSAVLKETLMATSQNVTSCVLPRAVALEARSTIHDILFPSKPKTYDLLSTLVLKHGFDEDMLQDESVPQAIGGEDETLYDHFGYRLAEIYDEVKNPSPHGRLERWLQRKSGTRYMLLATMIGVFIAVILGFLGLGVGIFQAWIAYQQWRHPAKGV